MAILADGTVICTDHATGKPCSEAATEEAVKQMLATDPVQQVGVGLGKPGEGGIDPPAPTGKPAAPKAGIKGK